MTPHINTRWHSGLDLTAPYGSPVRAAMAGTVIFAGRYFGYGNMVDVRHPDLSGIFTTIDDDAKDAEARLGKKYYRVGWQTVSPLT